MTKREELDLFLIKAEEMIDSKYILADIKIAGLLKSIASSDTLLALFKNCLTDFDYQKAKKTYLKKSNYSEGKGEFVLPTTSRELLAFIFNLLLDFDSKRISLSEFIDKYFYVDGSAYSGYSAFTNSLIRPFENSVKMLMEGVIDGRLQDPVEAFTEEEKRRADEMEKKEKEAQKEKELSKKAYAESMRQLRQILLIDKKRVRESRLSPREQDDLMTVISMLANVIESDDRDAVTYAYIAYRYAVKAHKLLFFGRAKRTDKLIKDVLNEL